MSRFFSTKYADLVPYVPGEQPQGRTFIKLNTNESPFPPSPKAIAAAAEAARTLHLYSDPDCRRLVEKLAQTYGLETSELVCTNGSDEVLNFAFMAFCDAEHPAVFPNATYGFYKVFAAVNGVPYEEIPLRPDFSIDVNDYIGLNKTIFLANPNAPSGLMLPVGEIERIVAGNPNSVVVVDEAYIDFGGESCLPLIRKYGNLLVTRTFSKSRSMAGARLGFGMACPALIADLNTLRFSTNPYNVNSMTMAAAIGALEDETYTRECCMSVCATREWTTAQLRELGFELNDSMTNFVFAAHPRISGTALCARLRERGFLVRHFDTPLLTRYNRISIGSQAQMEQFIAAVRAILEEV
ncbi:MAG: histidinol-phosphate transaminase [Pyramidobacter sp.]|nr:histidinol-phosphate transaminase [Pyramidobacter sp.]